MVLSLRRLSLTRPVCAIDVETTGLDPRHDRIVEVGVVRVEADGHVRILEQRVNPRQPIPAAACRVRPVVSAMVADRNSSPRRRPRSRPRRFGITAPRHWG
jgi:DNA polymerase III epsilon subunit-like protein